MAGSITLAKAIKVFEQQLGCGDENDRESTIDVITEGIEFVMFNGGGKILREWRIPINDGVFTFPRDLETPVKYKLGTSASSGFGIFNSPYMSYGSQGIRTCCGYRDWDNFAIATQPNRAFVQFKPPRKGVRLVATTKDPRDVGKKVMVQGNMNGVPVAPMHMGHKTAGELLTVYLDTDPNKRYGAYQFNQITGVVRDETCSYGSLWGLDCCDKFCFLAHYHPDDEHPSYVEAAVYGCGLGCNQCIHVLGRIDPSIIYKRDEEILPITSYEMLKLMARKARYESAGDWEKAAGMEGKIKFLIRQQLSYQGVSNKQLSVNLKASGYTLSNL